MNNYRLPTLIFCIITGLISACGSTESTEDTLEAETRTVQLSGLILADDGATPLAEATVTVGEVTASTDSNGFYVIDTVDVAADQPVMVGIEKKGYAKSTLPVALDDSDRYSSNADMVPTLIEKVIDFANATGTTSIAANNGSNDVVKIDIPTGSVSSDTPASVDIAFNDPTTNTGQASLPGESVGKLSTGSKQALEPVTAADITVRDYDGKKITSLNSPATVDLRIPDNVSTNYSAGDTIPWWSLDEASGQWTQEDADPSTADVIDEATVVDAGGGELYARGKITHLSWWAAKKAVNTPSCICVDVVDHTGAPVKGVEVEFTGSSYHGRSGKRKTKSNGRACVTTKASTDSVTETGTLIAHRGRQQFSYDVIDAAEGDTGTNLINLPKTNASTLNGDNPSICTVLTNKITLGRGSITGTVKDDATNPITGLTLYSSEGESAITNASGVYTLAATIGVAVDVYAPDIEKQTTTVNDATTPVILDFTLANRPPVIVDYTSNASDAAANDSTVNFSVSAFDPERQLLTYSWSTSDSSVITPDTTHPELATLAIPATGTGTTQVRVKVTDPRGRSVTRELNISWGTAFIDTGFKLTLLDNPTDATPIAGATVVLYNTDNKTIANTLTSDVNGVVDFGDIGRANVTFLVGRETGNTTGTQYRMNMFVDVPTASSNFYTDFVRDLDIAYDNQPFTCPGSTLGTATFEVTGIPTNGTNNRILAIGPKQGGYPLGAGVTTYSPTMDNVCPEHVQSDGTMSSLVKFSSDSALDRSYGVILDQTFPGTQNWIINLDQTFSSRALTVEGAHQYAGEVWAYRKGTGQLMTSFIWTDTEIEFADQFPADYHLIHGKYSETNTTTSRFTQRFGKRRYYDDVGTTGSMAVPPNSATVSTLEYDPVGNKINWLKTARAGNDISMISMIYQKDIAGDTALEKATWYVWMDENASSWTVPDLPAALSGWVDNSNLDNNFTEILTSLSVTLDDYDLTSNYSDVWRSVIAGDDLNAKANDQTYFRDYIHGQLNSRDTP